MNRPTLYLLLAVVTIVVGGVAITQPFFAYRAQRQIVASGLKDPDSAKYKDERISTNGNYCGQVNSKNSYGAYTGFKRVISETHCTAFFESGIYYVQPSAGLTGPAANCSGMGHAVALGITADRMEAGNAAIKARDSSGGTGRAAIPTDSELTHQIFERWWLEKCQQ